MRELNTASNTTVNWVIYTWLLLVSSSLGSLSNNDGDGNENVTLKGNSRCFKLYRADYISIKSSNVGHVLELNSKRLFWSSGEEKESRCLVFTSSTKREILDVHVVVVQCRQRNKQKKSALNVQSCCFANLNLLNFCRSRRCLLPIILVIIIIIIIHYHHQHQQHGVMRPQEQPL